MTDQYPALLIIVPLFASIGVFTLGWFEKRLCYPLTLAALGASLAFSLGLLFTVLDQGPVLYQLGGWQPPMGIALQIDFLNALFLPLVAGVAMVNLIGTGPAVRMKQQGKAPAFYTLYLLVVTGLLGIVATGDAFNLFVLLEIASLSSYAILAMGDERAPLSSLNYLLVGTVGSSFYLLGVGYLYIVTGSLNMVDIAALLQPLYGSTTVIVAFAICLIGVFIKMAFFPVHAWLSNVYTSASSPAASLIAPLTTKVMVYVMLRLMLTVFSPEFTFQVADFSGVIVWLAVLAIVAGSVMALNTASLKRMLTYVIIAEVGYMVGGAWLGTRAGMTGAMLHVFNDALMTLCVFLVVGNIVHVTGGHGLTNLKENFSRMPFTMAALVLGALSIIGVPPTCGFFSKWYLILGAIHAGQYAFMIALLFSSLINVILFFRVFEIGLFERAAPRIGHHGHGAAVQEAPAVMVVTTMAVALGLVAAGLLTNWIVTSVIEPAIPLTLS